ARAADTAEEWIASAEEELDRFASASAAAELAVHLAELREKEGEGEAATALWDRALAFDAERTIAHLRDRLAQNPRSAPLRTRLASVYEGRGRWGDLAELLDDWVQHAADA